MKFLEELREGLGLSSETQKQGREREHLALIRRLFDITTEDGHAVDPKGIRIKTANWRDRLPVPVFFVYPRELELYRRTINEKVGAHFGMNGGITVDYQDKRIYVNRNGNVDKIDLMIFHTGIDYRCGKICVMEARSDNQIEEGPGILQAVIVFAGCSAQFQNTPGEKYDGIGIVETDQGSWQQR